MHGCLGTMKRVVWYGSSGIMGMAVCRWRSGQDYAICVCYWRIGGDGLGMLIRATAFDAVSYKKRFSHDLSGAVMMTKIHMTIATTNREQVNIPWLWRLGRDFDLKVNILKANINEDFGWAFVELEGPVEEIQRATAWLHTTGLHIEPVERSVFG
ncbi:MAG: hypothetical protein CFK48_08125 [Armatimonadetes bacterium CP1_7O]|nr:MAG: hypothetical protein CFK48_08125 [Armatimonadetes bacterium CP1_7O]RMH09256.1 MAG: hypothetical protein D6697_04205 [Armatimonadota bacterium]